MSVILSAIWMAALKFKPLRINEPPLGALILLSQAFLKALKTNQEVILPSWLGSVLNGS